MAARIRGKAVSGSLHPLVLKGRQAFQAGDASGALSLCNMRLNEAPEDLLALELKALEQNDLSVNPAKIDGGSANNVVPDHAVLRFNIRPRTVSAAEGFERALAALIRTVEMEHEVAITVHGGITRPPKPVDARAQALFDLVADTSAALGRPLGWQASGGVCDGNNIAACGVPVVDTMGVRGGAIHSPREFLIVSSLAERAALSAVVLHRLATGAPL